MSNREKRETKLGYFILMPILLIFLLLFFYPAVKAFFESFTNSSLYVNKPKLIGIYNYLQMFSDSQFWNSLWHSFLLVFISVSLQYTLGLILALLLKEELKGLKWVKFIVMIPWVIPVAATVVMFDWMVLPKYGLFNMILERIGLEKLTCYWFGDEKLAFPMIIIMHIWRNMPFYAIALFAAMKTIPKCLYEAAEIDGANSWQSFRAITLPNLKYTSMIIIILHVLWTFNNFDFVYLSTGGGPVGKTEVISTQVYQTAWNYYEYGRASAIGIIMMLIMMIFTVIYIKLVRSEIL